MTDTPPSIFRLILWPSVLTLGVSIVRLVGEVQGWITNASGGGGTLLGITWLIFVFGAWFGFRLSRTGSEPKRRPAPVWTLVPVLAVIGTFFFRMRGVDLQDTSPAAEASLRETLRLAAMVAGGGALLGFVVWPRLALALLVYGLIARTGVMVITWLAKASGWNTHYTKLGPAGIEKDMAETLASTGFAQFGFWVPVTVVFGMLLGSLFSRRSKG